MKTAAIIAEYNPFHKGHRYQIEETRKATGADYILVLMSGDFVQRGEPAIYNKYIRTRMALLGGADAVLELPVLYATSSAEFFAEGAVTLLDHMQMVDFLSFGSESGKLEDFLPLAELLNRKEATVLSTVNELLRQGLSYPKARSRAVSLLFPEYSSADAAFFSSPNNILALEYCKTLKKLKSSIKPFTLLRKGSGYHDPFLPEDSSVYPSASALRSLITASTSSQFLTADDLSPQLFYKLLTEKDCGFSDYLDCSTALSDRICKHLSSFTGYKMMGVNAYSAHKDWALKLADWFTNEDNQMLRLKERDQGPSNINAAASDEVKKVPAIQAVMDQAQYGTLQRVGNSFWDVATDFGNLMATGNTNGADPQEVIDTLVSGITQSTVQ